MGRQEGEVMGRKRAQEMVGLRIELASRRYCEGHGPLPTRKAKRFGSPPSNIVTGLGSPTVGRTSLVQENSVGVCGIGGAQVKSTRHLEAEGVAEGNDALLQCDKY